MPPSNTLATRNEHLTPKSTKRYQTRRNQEIRQRDARKQEREQARQQSAELPPHRTPDFDYYEDVVPVAEPDNIVRYWRISRLREEWNTVRKRLGLGKNDLETFIASRRRPAPRCSDTPCPPVKYPGWYLGGATGIE